MSVGIVLRQCAMTALKVTNAKKYLYKLMPYKTYRNIVTRL